MTHNGVNASANQKPKSRVTRRKAVPIAALSVVALGVTAGFVVPNVIHSQRIAEYHELVGVMNSALNERAEADATLQAAAALTHARHSEALSLAEAVATLGDVKEPVLPAAHAEALRDAASSAAAEIGPLAEIDDSDRELHELLTTLYVETKAVEEHAHKEAKEAGTQAPETTMPESIGKMSIAQAAQLIDTPLLDAAVEPVEDEEVTAELVEELKASLVSVRSDIASRNDAIAAESTRHEAIDTTVLTMLPKLQEAAATVSDYQEAVEHSAPKAENSATERMRSAAEQALENADSTDVAELYSRVASFVAAGEAALTSHNDVVKAEEAEANRLAEERAAQERAAQSSGSNASSSEGWASGGLCNYWAPLGGGMYMAPC